jgi:hypothetical protein
VTATAKGLSQKTKAKESLDESEKEDVTGLVRHTNFLHYSNQSYI